MQRLLFLLEVFLLFILFYRFQFTYFNSDVGNTISIAVVFTFLVWIIFLINKNNVWSKDNFLFEVTPEKLCDGGPYMYSSDPYRKELCSKFSNKDLNRFECSNGFIGRPVDRTDYGPLIPGVTNTSNQ
jgi:hypothetical protein